MILNKHIEAATAAYKTAYPQLDQWRRNKENRKKSVLDESQKLTREAANDLHSIYVKDFDEQYNTIRSTLETEISAIKEQYIQEVMGFYTASGTDIDTTDKALLDTGIPTKKEISNMIKKYALAENITMLRILSSYANDHKINLEDEDLIYTFKAKSGGDKELKVFQSLNSLLAAPLELVKDDSISLEMFLKSAIKADEYADAAKYKLLKLKIFIDDETKEKIQTYENSEMERNNRARHETLENEKPKPTFY